MVLFAHGFVVIFVFLLEVQATFDSKRFKHGDDLLRLHSLRVGRPIVINIGDGKRINKGLFFLFSLDDFVAFLFLFFDLVLRLLLPPLVLVGLESGKFCVSDRLG